MTIGASLRSYTVFVLKYFSALLRKVEVQRLVLADCRHIPQGPVSTSAIVGTNGHILAVHLGVMFVSWRVLPLMQEAERQGPDGRISI